jgi:outer membrane receptor protein involved in Fe transport
MAHKFSVRRATIFLAFGFIMARGLNSQTTTADVIGRVTDATGAIVPEAKATLTNLDTNISRTADTNQSGDYVFNLVAPGRYSVRVEKSGFKVFTVPEITLAAGDRSRVDAQMAVGQTSETVEVTAQAALLQTDSSSLGTSVTGRLVQDIPLNGRNYIQLTQMVAGVSSGPGNGLATGSRPDDRRLNSSFSVNGQDPVANNNMIDGLDNNERFIGTIGVRPSIDAILEFKVQTNLYSAEVTRASAGVVNILTKSGTNAFHGSLFEFLRNDALDANGNFNFTGQPSAQLPKAKFRQNQWGGSLGGPIQKDRSFFFVDYEKLSIRQGVPIVAQVPTAKQRIGDFSENCTAGFDSAGMCASSAQQLTVTNPFGSAPVGPVPFNRLDLPPYSSSLDPIALKIAAMYPLPTSNLVNLNNFSSSPNRPQDQHTFDIRIDHRFSDKTNLFGRYSFNDVATIQPSGFPVVNGIQPAGRFPGFSDFTGPNNTRAQSYQLNLVHIFRPNLLLELKAGYGRTAIQSRTGNDGQNTSNQLGFPCNAVSCINIGDTQTYGLPRIVIQGGFQELGDAIFVPLLQFDNTYQWSGAVTWTHGGHNVKFGASTIYRQFSLVQSARPRGEFTFNASTATAAAATNFGFANFLAGTPVQIQRQASLYKPGYRSWEPGFYVQDDWRATRWLTLNLGVRYDVYTAKTEQYNRLANFDPLTATILVAGDNASASAGIDTDYGNVAPRIGFAATLGNGMVLRGGYGLSFFPMDYTSAAALKNLPFTSALQCGTLVGVTCPAGTGTFSQGVPRPADPSSYAKVNGAIDLTQIPPSTLVTMDRNFQASYTQQFNVLLEKQFGNSVATAGYVGMRGGDIAMNIPDINRALPNGTGPALPRPFAAFPRLGQIGYLTPQGSSEYNAFQTSFNRRLSKGLTFTSSYTYAVAHDNVTGLGTGTGGYGNLVGAGLAQAVKNVQTYDWANSDFNIKSRFTFGGNYDLPFGKSLKGAANVLVAGWQVNGFFGWQTGLPFTVTMQSAVSRIAGLGASTERPNLTSENIRVANPTVGNNGQFLDPTAFGCTLLSPGTTNAACTPNVASGTLGNAPRNVGYGPRQSVINMSVFKNFTFSERYTLQFRTEFFNLPNHPVFDRPQVNNLGNANFGKIVALAPGYQMRQIQFALKLLF